MTRPLDLDGKKVVVTGKFALGTRAQVSEHLRGLGATPVKSLSNKVDYLIVGEAPGSKLSKAQALGVTILSEQDLTGSGPEDTAEVVEPAPKGSSKASREKPTVSAWRWTAISSEGGPFLIADGARFERWRGTDAAAPGDPSDYDQACALDHDVSQPEDDSSLLFWNLPGPGTAWVGRDDGQVVLTSAESTADRKLVPTSDPGDAQVGTFDLPSGLLVACWAPVTAKEVLTATFGEAGLPTKSLGRAGLRKLTSGAVDGLGAVLSLTAGGYEVRCGSTAGAQGTIHWCRLVPTATGGRATHPPVRWNRPTASVAPASPAAPRPQLTRPSVAFLTGGPAAPAPPDHQYVGAHQAQMMWHPEEGHAWIALAGQSIWRCRDEGFEHIADEGLADYEPDTALLYYDSARRAPSYAYLPGYDEPAVLHRYEGDRFKACPLEGGPTAQLDTDRLAYDPRRNALVHFHSDKAKKELVVFELVDDAWQQVGRSKALHGSKKRWTVWDGESRRVLVLDERGVALAWDGAELHKAPALPKPARDLDLQRVLEAPSGQPMFCGWNIRKGALRVWELGDGKWKASKIPGVVDVAAGVCDPKSGSSVLFAFDLAKRPQTYLTGRLKSDLEIQPGLAVNPLGRLLVHGDDVLLYGSPTYFLDSPRLQLGWLKTEAQVLHPLKPLSAPLLGVVGSPKGPIAVTWEGDIYRISAKGAARICERPRDFTARCTAAVTYLHQEYALLVTGGVTPDHKERQLRQTWLWSDAGWRRLKGKAHPSTTGDSAAWDSHRRRTVLHVDGFESKPHLTWELTDGGWEKTESQLDRAMELSRLVELDEKSQQVFMVGGCPGDDDPSTGVWVYRGAGRWEFAGEITGPDGQPLHIGDARAIGFDPSSRSLLTHGLALGGMSLFPGLSRANLGRLLDG